MYNKILQLACLLFFMVLFLMASSELNAEPSKRSKNINFDDEMIEGINRKPLDSVNQISERDAQRRAHLYRKRAGFADRDKILLRELELKP